ncbi:MAG TPA: hypothetical protein VFR76_11850, partial [Verrucomicrobiae bacterium]|nr:hypothetical protein [Verrucomicrobiae bacterium]
MTRFRRQLFTGIVSLGVASAVALMAHAQFSRVLPNYAYLTGWLLFAVMVVLAAYNVWKKLPFLPLGNSESWLQFHIYAGFFTVILFLIHVSFRVPTGWFEGTLAWLYVLVTGS